jgi:hypothetical protein
MGQQDQVLLFWAQIAQGFGALLSVLVALYIAMQVHNYTRRRDKLEFMRQRWHEQQTINLAVLSNPELIKVAETITYGYALDGPKDLSKKFYYLFLMINQIHHHYLAYSFGIYSLREFRRFSLPTLSLIAREAETIEYLLTERGYLEDFRQEVLSLLKKATPPAQPSLGLQRTEKVVPQKMTEVASS